MTYRDMSPHPDRPDDYSISDDGEHVICAHCCREYSAHGTDAFNPCLDNCAEDCPQYDGLPA